MQTTLFTAQTAQTPGVQNIAASLIPQNRQDLERLIYGNGGNCPATIIFHADPGHGWLQVPHSLIKTLGIGKKITGYSYRDTHYAYLEEDCDFSTFLNALEIPANGLMKDFWQICPQEERDPSPIRSKRHY